MSATGNRPTPLAPKGMNDVLPSAQDAFLTSHVWQHILTVAGEVTRAYGYAPVWLPLVEETALFARGLGEDTEVVSKEMYSFTDRGNRQLSLRPEGTAGAARAYIQHHLGRNEPVQRWFYQGPMFRAERPQKGRYRQFYQLGAECFGLSGPGVDVEMLGMLHVLCQRLGLGNVRIRGNTLGDVETRVRYRGQLQGYLAAQQDGLCGACRARWQHNPLRVLDCKEAACQQLIAGAPDILDALSAPSARWFAAYQSLVAQQPFAYVRDKRLVRGLDYYSDAIFEFQVEGLGAQDAILGGGRYDGLVPSLGGPAAPAVGFAAGLERLALLVAQAQTAAAPSSHLFVAVQAPTALPAALALADGLRAQGLRVEVGSDAHRLKAALKRADRAGARAVLVLGDQELRDQRARLRRLRDGHTQELALTVAALQGALRADEA